MNPDLETLEAGVVSNLNELGISANSHLIVAVSGGLDSMVLMHMIAQLPSGKRPSMTVGHLNHGLRDSESDLDQRCVELACEQFRLPFVTKTLADGQIDGVKKQTIEEAARSIRYQWLEETALATGSTAIATGHHADDQIETVLHHLIRGTGLRGLQGMQRERYLPMGIRLLRPLLPFSRNQLQSYADHWQIAIREDSTNVDTTFTRNKIRHQLIPTATTQDGADLIRTVSQLGSSATDGISVLDRISLELASSSIVTRTANHVLLRVSPLGKMPDLVRSHFFTWLWIQQAWPRKKMATSHWQKLSEATKKAAPLRFQLPGRVDVIRQSEWLRLVRNSFVD